MGKDHSLFDLCFLRLVLLLCIAGSSAQAQTAPLAALLTAGIHCGMLADCTRFDQIGLHVSTAAAVQTDSPSSRWDASGAVRLALSALDLAEVGVSLPGRISHAPERDFTARLLPVSLYARLRLLPLPLPRLKLVPWRVALTYQHELASETFGGSDAAGASQGILRLLVGQSIRRLDLDAGLGVSLVRPDGQRPHATALELSAMASLWLWHGVDAVPSDELRLTAEGLVRFPLVRGVASEQNVLLGFLGRSPRGYGGGVSIGAQFFDEHPGFLVLGRVQVSWGKKHQNPWAERKAAEPHTTPAFIWELLGAIDPVLGADGCVWTDPSPQRPSTRWFCVGQPDPQDKSQIILQDGKRLPVGTHLWELNGSLRLNDGDKVVSIPLQARVRKAVWDYLDEHQRQFEQDKEAHRQRICSGRVGMLHGLDGGTAAMAALDEQGGQASLLAAELLQQLYCGKDKSPQEQALSLLGAVGGLRRHGPLRARMPLRSAESAASAGEAPGAKPGGGAPSVAAAEHTVPPRLAGVILSAEARKHLLQGDLDPRTGRSTGWHYEPTGSAEKGTYVVQGTRSEPDVHGIFEANVIIEGVKKGSRSSFFPSHWTIAEIETAIEEAYRKREPSRKLGRFQGVTAQGMKIEMDVNPKGQIQTAYPVYRGGE